MATTGEEVRNWLRSFGLQQYASDFVADGWEKLEELFHIDEKDLKHCIPKPGHRKRFHLAVEDAKSLAADSLTVYAGAYEAGDGIDAGGDESSIEMDVIPIHPKTEEVERWLKRNGLGQYILKFVEEGWDNLEVLLKIDEENIKVCIDKPGHRKKFQIALRRGDHMSTEQDETIEKEIFTQRQELESWLTDTALSQYTEQLTKEGWDTMEVLFELLDSEEDLKRCISKPGHRKRFQLSVNKCRLERETTHLRYKRPNINDAYPSVKTEGCIFPVKEPGSSTQPIITPSQDAKTSTYPDDCNDECKVPSSSHALTEESGNAALEVYKEMHIHDKEETEVKKIEAPTERMAGYDDSQSGSVTQVKAVDFGLSFDETESESDTSFNHMTDKDDDFEDSSPISTSRTDGHDRDVHVDTEHETEGGRPDPRQLQRTYSIPSATFIHPKNVSVGGTIIDNSGKLFTKTEKKKYRDNFKKQMKTALEGSKEKDAIFVETKAFEKLQSRVELDNWAVVIGVPGDGKTAMAIHMSLKYNARGYDHLELHFARDWKDWVDGSCGNDNGKKQFILIDDIFGRMSIDERKVSEWIAIIDFMQKVVKQRKGCLKVVCTSRKYVFEDIKTKLAQYPFFQESAVVDMTQEHYALTNDERKQMWEKHAQKSDKRSTMPEWLNEDKSTPHGFPHCVDLFFSSPSLQNEGVNFFKDPMQFICREIDNFKDHDKIKYFALLLVLFYNNQLTEVSIEEVTMKGLEFKQMVSATGLSNLPTSSDLKKALQGLHGTYISELDGCFGISHDSIRENLAFVFIKQNTSYALENIQFDYLTDHTRCFGQDTEGNKKIHILKPDYNKHLVKRMIKEIKNGNVVAVCAHQAWDDKNYVDCLIQKLLEEPKNGNAERSSDTLISHVFNTKDSSTSYIFDFNLWDSLRFFGHRSAVNQLTGNKELGRLLDQLPGQNKPQEEHVFERPLSLQICRIMDNIGASQALREFQIYAAISMELLDTVCVYISEEQFRCYIFGSHSEGTRIITRIPKRDCDVNYVFCSKNYEVIQDVSEIKADENTQYLLMVTDTITKTGYVKLQIIRDGVPQTCNLSNNERAPETDIDHEGRIVLYKRHPDKIHVDEIRGSKTTTKIVTGTGLEIYYSYRCRSWPKIATKWISRFRHSNWPSRSAIEQMKSLGVFLVPVGSQGSIEKHLEWKILFLLQERMLMSLLNGTQYKCYIILKMINNDIISSQFKEPVLLSYHVKTCMLYVVENTPPDLWKPTKLMDCIQVCLKRILQCTDEGSCPNYFIPQENLFHRRVHGEVQTKLRNILSMLLSTEIIYWYLPMIQCGNLGPRLEQAITGVTGTLSQDHDLVPSTVRLYLKLSKFIAMVKMRILCKGAVHDVGECVERHFLAVSQLRQAEEIIDHSKDQTKAALALVLPHVELSLMCNLVVREMKMTDDPDYLENLLLSEKWNEVSINVNPISAKLKQATFLYKFRPRYTDASISILKSLESTLGPRVLSVCGCQYHHTEVDDETKEVVKNLSEPVFRMKYCVPCVSFLPTERDIIPSVLADYEMCRSKNEDKNSPTTRCLFWYNWAIVDGKVLLYMMLYLNYKALLESEDMLDSTKFDFVSKELADSIEKLEQIINGDPNLGHKTTGLNILGWIYRQESNEVAAKKYFTESEELQPRHNAANLHIDDLKLCGSV